MGELTMPQTAEAMQPEALAAFYEESLAVGSFEDGYTGAVVYSRFAEVKPVLGTPDVFGNAYPADPRVPGTLSPRFPLGERAMGEAIDLFSEIPANTAGGDGVRHERNRRVMEDLVPIGHGNAAAQLGEDIAARVDALTARGLRPELAAPDTQSALGNRALAHAVDAVPATRELTMQIIADFLGVPNNPEMRQKLLQGGADQIALLGTPTTEEEQLRRLAGFRQLWTLTQELVGQTNAGAPNYTGQALAHQTDGLPTLIPLEVAGANINLKVAGFSTLYESITNGLRWMAEHPDDWEQAITRTHSMDRITGELLRLGGGIYAWGRVALQEVELGGRRLAPGTPVLGLIGAANRDPRHFGDHPSQDPNRLIPDRRVRNDLVFGTPVGREQRLKSHFCVGAGIAKVVMSTFFGGFARDYPDFRLAQPEPPMKHNVIFREQAALPLQLQAAR